MLDQIIQHFDKMSSIVAVHDGLAMMVNAVTVEHEVEW